VPRGVPALEGVEDQVIRVGVANTVLAESQRHTLSLVPEDWPPGHVVLGRLVNPAVLSKAGASRMDVDQNAVGDTDDIAVAKGVD